MADQIHKFKVGQTVDLIPSMSRFAARGHYQIVSLRPADSESPQYRIKSKSESHERVVAESDLILSAPSEFRLIESGAATLSEHRDRIDESGGHRKEADNVQDS